MSTCIIRNMEPKIITKFCSYDQLLARIFKSIQSDLFFNVKCYIAGGSAQKLYLKQELDGSDIDIWFENLDDYNRAKAILSSRFTFLAMTDNSDTYNIVAKDWLFDIDLKIQLISKVFYPNEDDLVFDDFDFTICQVVYNNGRIILSNEAYRDIRDKILRINPRYKNELSIMRVIKYMNRGYVPTIKLFDQIFLQDRETLKVGDLILTGNSFYG